MTKADYIKGFLRNNAVLVIATVLAIVSCFIVPPDKEYLGYFDFRTLTCLFGMSAVISALKNIRFFRLLARKVIKVFKTTRSAITALVFITYIASMLIANDMALLTFLPLGYFVLNSAKKEKYMAFTFTMQTISANLGGMLTPFGNPQNLYLYNRFNIPTGEFFSIMLLPTLFSVALIVVCCLFIKKEQIEPPSDPEHELDKPRAIVCAVLFIYMIVLVFRVVPFWTGFVVIPVMLALDRSALAKVDYPLLLTFCMFFIVVGNISRLSAVDKVMSAVLDKSTFLTGVASCQIISNVPSAVLLSGFTNNYKSLLIAVNVGGCGTLISSMASLISFKTFTIYKPREKVKYLLINSLFSFGFLFALTAFCLILI